MRRLVAIAVCLGLALAATDADARRKRRGKKSGASSRQKARGAVTPGEVQSIAGGTAYLDRGEADGLTAGATVTFLRGNRSAGTCVLTAVSAHFATCPVGTLRLGDRFTLQRVAPPEAPKQLEPLPSDATLAARAKALAAAELPLEDFDGSSGGRLGGPRVTAALSHSSHSNLVSAAGPFQVQRLDVGVHGVEVARGLRASVDLTALTFSRRPDAFRSAYRASPVLLVRRLELDFRRDDLPVTATLGRLWTRATPGLLVLDGVQAGLKAKDGSLEGGLYGGLLPDAVSLMPSTTQWTAGAFGLARFTGGEKSTPSLLQVEGRAAFAVKDNVGQRMELGLAAHGYRGKTLDGHAVVELGFGDAQAPAGLDALRLSAGWRPTDTVRLVGGLRYRGTTPSGVLEIGMGAPGQRAVHADLCATLEVQPWLWVAVSGGAASDVTAGLTQAQGGPEVVLPTLFGRGGGLRLGYREEMGWLRARHAWAQASVVPLPRLRLLTSVLWAQQVDSAPSPGLAGHEMGVTAMADVTLTDFLWLRLSLTGRGQPMTPASGPSGTAGLASVQLGGSL